jgi:hypothetical protein
VLLCPLANVFMDLRSLLASRYGSRQARCKHDHPVALPQVVLNPPHHRGDRLSNALLTRTVFREGLVEIDGDDLGRHSSMIQEAGAGVEPGIHGV